MLCDGQNGLSDLLQHRYTLCGCENGFSELLQASYTLCGGQNLLTKLLKIYMPCTRFTEVRTLRGSQNLTL